MKSINLFVINGTMATGKTSLIKEIKNQNINVVNKIHFLDEENFYKFKKEHYKNLKIKEQIDNFNFSVQVYLLNNFMSLLTKTISDFVNNDISEIDIVSDTFPITTGIIFTTFKRQFDLINKNEYDILMYKYDVAIKDLGKIFNLINVNEIKFNVFHYYRIIEYNYGLQNIKIRSLDEFDFYNKNLDYYKTINEFMSNSQFAPEKVNNIFKLIANTFEYSLQKINCKEDYDIYNKVILNKLYQ